MRYPALITSGTHNHERPTTMTHTDTNVHVQRSEHGFVEVASLDSHGTRLHTLKLGWNLTIFCDLDTLSVIHHAINSYFQEEEGRGYGDDRSQVKIEMLPLSHPEE